MDSVYREHRDSREGFMGGYDPTVEDWREWEEYLDTSDDYDDEDEYDGQPDEYTEWQDYYGGDDWDHGQYDETF